MLLLLFLPNLAMGGSPAVSTDVSIVRTINLLGEFVIGHDLTGEFVIGRDLTGSVE